MTDVSHFVNGSALAGASGRFSDIFDPNTGEVVTRAPLASLELI